MEREREIQSDAIIRTTIQQRSRSRDREELKAERHTNARYHSSSIMNRHLQDSDENQQGERYKISRPPQTERDSDRESHGDPDAFTFISHFILSLSSPCSFLLSLHSLSSCVVVFTSSSVRSWSESSLPPLTPSLTGEPKLTHQQQEEEEEEEQLRDNAQPSTSSRNGAVTPSSLSRSSSDSTLSSFSLHTRLFFSWVGSLFARGSARGWIEFEDLLPLKGKESTDHIAELFHQRWSHELSTSRVHNRTERWKAWRSKRAAKLREPSLLKVLWSCFGWSYASLGLIKLVSDCLMFTGPILLGYVVSFMESYENAKEDDSTKRTQPETSWHGYLYAGLLVAGVLLNAILSTQYNFHIRRIGLYLRACIVSSVYRKSLTISNTSRQEFTIGQINNIMSVDTDRVSDVAISLHEFWSLPIQIGIALYLLYAQVSWSLLAGVMIVVILIPINAWLTKRIQTVSKAMMKFKDARLSLLDELIRHIRNVKFLSLESRFRRRIMSVREDEMAQLSTRKYLDAWCVFFWASTSLLVSLATFAMYSWWLGHTLTSSKVFSSLALFNILIRPLNAFPWVVNGLVEGGVSIGRVYRFLIALDRSEESLETVDEDEDAASEWTTQTSPHVFKDGELRVKLKGKEITTQVHSDERCVVCVEGGWNFTRTKKVTEKEKNASHLSPSSSHHASSSSPSSSSSRPSILHNLHLHLYASEFVLVCGPVGSSKSALLLTILDEMAPVRASHAKLATRGRVAYVSQDAWIPNGTIRETILFHSPYDSVRYRQVLQACALELDLDAMPAGDLTEIGEGGINLSGGQIARIGLARACYARAEIVLMDDPLSAVDAHVGAHLIRHVLNSKTGLLKACTRVLVTHQVEQVRREVDRVWVMKEGEVVEEIVRRPKDDDDEEEAKELEPILSLLDPSANTSPVAPSSSTAVTAAAAAVSTTVTSPAVTDPDSDSNAKRLDKGFLTLAESRQRGTIRSKVLRRCTLHSSGGVCVSLCS